MPLKIPGQSRETFVYVFLSFFVVSLPMSGDLIYHNCECQATQTVSLVWRPCPPILLVGSSPLRGTVGRLAQPLLHTASEVRRNSGKPVVHCLPLNCRVCIWKVTLYKGPCSAYRQPQACESALRASIALAYSTLWTAHGSANVSTHVAQHKFGPRSSPHHSHGYGARIPLLLHVCLFRS